MSEAARRTMLAEGTIGIALAAGAYFAIVDPLNRSAQDERRRRDTSFMEQRSHDAARSRADLEAMRGRIRLTAQRSELSADELAVMGQLSRAAEARGMDVHSIEKIEASASGEPAPGAPALQGAPPPGFRRHGFSIVSSGSFEQAVGLCEAIRHEMGFATIDSARLTPTGDADDPRIQLSIETSHWWFDSGAASTALDAAWASAQPPENLP